MKNIPREFLAGIGCALVAVMLIVFASGAPEGGVTGSARGTYDAAPAQEPRWVPLDVAALWSQGRDPFTPSTDRRDLPAEDLGLPDFPPNPAPVFPLRPTPDPKSVQVKMPLVAATDLPTDEMLTAWRALGKSTTPGGGEVIPEAPTNDVLITPNGKIEGTILEVSADGTVRMKIKNSARVFKRGEYTEIRYAQSFRKQYEERAAKITGSPAGDHRELAKWCVTVALPEEAAKEYLIAIRLRPDLETIGLLGDLYQAIGDPDGEIRLYREMSEKQMTGIEGIWMRLGRAYEALGLTSRAVDAYVGATRVALYHAESRSRLAVLFALDGRMSEADEQATRLSNDGPTKAAKETHLALGVVAYMRGRFDVARTELTEGGTAAAGLIACVETCEGKVPAAVAAFKAALEANPDQIDHWLNLGVLCGLGGDWPRARVCFEEAAWRAPVSALPHAALGWAWLREGKVPEATAAYAEALKRDPRCAQALLGAGKIALDSGDAKVADEKLLSALKAGAGSAGFRELGLARLRNRNTSGAVEALRRAIEDSADPDSHALLGFAILPTSPEAAEAEFRRAQEGDRDHVLAQCGLAAVAYNRRDLAEATNRFEAVLSRDATNAFAQRGIRLAKEAATRTLWEDDFERKDGDAVRKQWVEREKEGLKVALSRGRATFAGKQIKDDGMTAVLRPTTDKFLAFEAEIDFEKCGRATAGLILGLPVTQQSPNPVVLRFARSGKGRLVAFSGQLLQPPTWQDLGEAQGNLIRLRIERAPTAQGNEWLLFANGTQVGKVRADVRAAKLEVGAFGNALKDDAWELSIDNVRLIEAK